MRPFDISGVRSHFPALKRTLNGDPVVYFDGPAGSQVPQMVPEAVSRYLTGCNANHGGVFATSRESDTLLAECHRWMADFLGTEDADCIYFGANMTSLTFALSRALARTWKPGDEILVTRLDHDANVTPWVLAARDAGATVRHVGVRLNDCTLDLDEFRSLLSERTKLVAIGYASNATGTINPVAEMTRLAHAVGAKVFIDAVHFAPHDLVDVKALGCDFLACSAYKFFGPHVGVMYGKREWLESLTPYKLRPAPDDLPGKWMTGTQNHEGIAGVRAAVEYLAMLGRTTGADLPDRRAQLSAAFAAIREYELQLTRQMLAGLREFESLRVWGITDLSRLSERVPTFSITHSTNTPQDLAARLAESGIFTWVGNFYALPFTEAAGLEPQGTLRIGLLHYNTPGEIERLLERLREVL